MSTKKQEKEARREQKRAARIARDMRMRLEGFALADLMRDNHPGWSLITIQGGSKVVAGLREHHVKLDIRNNNQRRTLEGWGNTAQAALVDALQPLPEPDPLGDDIPF